MGFPYLIQRHEGTRWTLQPQSCGGGLPKGSGETVRVRVLRQGSLSLCLPDLDPSALTMPVAKSAVRAVCSAIEESIAPTPLFSTTSYRVEGYLAGAMPETRKEASGMFHEIIMTCFEMFSRTTSGYIATWPPLAVNLACSRRDKPPIRLVGYFLRLGARKFCLCPCLSVSIVISHANLSADGRADLCRCKAVLGVKIRSR